MEENLIRRAKVGDEQAYIELFTHYERDLYRYAFIQTKNQEDALDVVQEVAYRSFKGIHKLKEPTYFKTWLYRICMNACFDLLKKRKIMEPLQEERHHVLDIDDQDLHLTIEQLLTCLTIQERQIIYLKYFEDYTIAQIAELLTLKLGTTKTILYRAIGKLKAAYKEVI